MIATKHTQSLTDFRQNATQTLDRLNRTGEAELITVNGRARAVLISPTAYDELTRDAMFAADVTVIRKAMREIDAGEGDAAAAFFEGLRGKLVAIKSRRPKPRRK